MAYVRSEKQICSGFPFNWDADNPGVFQSSDESGRPDHSISGRGDLVRCGPARVTVLTDGAQYELTPNMRVGSAYGRNRGII